MGQNPHPSHALACPVCTLLSRLWHLCTHRSSTLNLPPSPLPPRHGANVTVFEPFLSQFPISQDQPTLSFNEQKVSADWSPSQVVLETRDSLHCPVLNTVATPTDMYQSNEWVLPSPTWFPMRLHLPKNRPH